PRFHLVKYLIDRGERERAYGVAEVIEHRGLSEGAFGTEERHLERLLLRKTRRHDLTEQAQDLRIAQQPGVARLGLPQHLRFALRAIEIHRPRAARLRDPDLLREARPLVDQRAGAPRASGRAHV